MFYLTLFLLFIYFKLARVHQKEERVDWLVIILHLFVGFSAVVLYRYGIEHHAFWSLLLVSFLFFIAAALAITAVQVGIFVEGKPLLGMGLLFKWMPPLGGIIIGLTLMLGYVQQ